MPAALGFLYCPDCRFFAICQLDVINLNVELSAARHALLVLGGSHSADGDIALWYDNYVVDLHFFQYFKVDVVASLRIGGAEISVVIVMEGPGAEVPAESVASTVNE